MPETLDATQWLCQICIEKPCLCKFRKTIPRAKMFAIEITLLHTRKTAKTPISKTLICYKRQKVSFKTLIYKKVENVSFTNICSAKRLVKQH